MTTKKTTSTLRRCSGSTRFGIEPHDAPIAEFPKQPSQKDGLGRMCQEHWRTYTSGLRKDALARKEPTKGSTQPQAPEREPAQATKPKTRTRKAAKPSAKPGEVERAEALIAEVDALPGPEMAARVGDDDVQAALQMIANGGSVETPPAETIDGGTGEADAA